MVKEPNKWWLRWLKEKGGGFLWLRKFGSRNNITYFLEMKKMKFRKIDLPNIVEFSSENCDWNLVFLVQCFPDKPRSWYMVSVVNAKPRCWYIVFIVDASKYILMRTEHLLEPLTLLLERVTSRF